MLSKGLSEMFKTIVDKKFDLIRAGEYIPSMFVLRERKMIFIFILMVTMMIFSGILEAQKRKGIVLEEIKIEGTIQKPEVMQFLSRAKFTYRTLELDVTFTEKVEKALYVDEAF